MDKRAGFTLVELSIVLVIIGLLIGGILAAQSMITTAKVQAAVSQIGQFDVAVRNFQSKYNSLPGDSKLFSGNGDGSIVDATGYNNEFSGEIAHFWMDLQSSGFTYRGKTFSSTLIGGKVDTDSQPTNAPKFALGKDAAVLGEVFDVNDVVLGYTLKPINAYSIAHFTGDVMTPTPDPVLTPEEALAIDLKIDDGKPVSGIVEDSLIGYSSNAFPSGSACTDYNSFMMDNIDTATYQLGAHDAVCFLSVGMLGTILTTTHGA